MRFAIFTHVEHQKLEGNYYAYSPYVREMNIWFKYVDEVEIVGPAPLLIAIGTDGEFLLKDSYQHSQITFTKVPSFDLLNFTNTLKAAFRIPSIIFKIVGAMKRADHLHLRCPGNIGLLACICQIFFPHKSKTAKYAGNWDPGARQPWSYRLQKWILANTFLTRNMKVLVYGDWPNQSKNILPFFTASFSKSEIEENEKKFCPSYKFLFVGNLVPGKQPGVAFQIVTELNKRNIPSELHVYGNGEMINSFRDHTKNKAYFHLHGNQPLEILKEAYKESHFLILASKSEGWPKAVAEAMWFGCIPIATAVSCVSWMLGGGSRGILISDSYNCDGNPLDSGERNLSEPLGEEMDSRDGLNKVDRGQRTEDRLKVKNGLLDTFQKSSEFEGLSNYHKKEPENLSETGFSDTLEVTENRYVIEDTVTTIIELIKNPVEMRRMSIEAREWSQEYTLEKFEEAIEGILRK